MKVNKKRKGLIVFGFSFLITSCGVSDHMRYGYDHMHEGYGGIIMMVIWVLVILLVAGIIYALWKRGGGPAAVSGTRTPMEILKSRYASGEISKDEYEEMKKDIDE